MTDMAEKARKGIPITHFDIIDCHCHMGNWFNFHVPEGGAEGMLSSMDALGIKKAFITAHASIGPDYKYGNDMVLEALEKYPDRFLGYVTVNPNYGENEMAKELERCFGFPGMKGIKLHPSMHGCPMDYKTYHTAYKAAQERKCPVLIHVWGNGDVSMIDQLAGQYPEAIFIMGHAGAEIRAMELAVEVVNRHSNVYADLALSRIYEGNVEWFVSQIGSKKLLFGSDLPFMDPRPSFGRVAMAEISEEEKEDIFGMNMKRLLYIQQ